jgi:hypothetical protein
MLINHFKNLFKNKLKFFYLHLVSIKKILIFFFLCMHVIIEKQNFNIPIKTHNIIKELYQHRILIKISWQTIYL